MPIGRKAATYRRKIAYIGWLQRKGPAGTYSLGSTLGWVFTGGVR